MRVRWSVLLIVVLLPLFGISILLFDGVQMIQTGAAPSTTHLYWSGVHALLLLPIYGYPRVRHGLTATFYYWKIYIECIYPLYQIPIRYSIASLTLGSLIITGLIVVVTQPTPQTGLIIITAFYASVLFFREIFSNDVPVLEMDDLIQMGAGMGKNVSFQTDIGNVGSRTATEPTVKFRVYDLNGHPLTDPMDADLPSGNRALEPGEWTEGGSVTIYFERDDITEEPPETAYLHTKAYGGFGYALLADNKLQKIDIPVQTW